MSRTRRYTLTAATLMLSVSACSYPTKAQNQRTATFIDTIGVNVHLAYTNGAYGKLDQVTNALDYLNIKTLRDHAPNTQTLPLYNKMAQAGFKFDFVVNSGNVSIIAQRFATFGSTYPGALVAVEGPNEVNNWPITYQAQTGTKAALSYQAALYDAIKANPVTAKTPVYNFTDYPQSAGKADFMNLHPYPKRGSQPYATLSPDLAMSAPPMPGVPRVITEIGYTQMADPAQWAGLGEWNPVNENVQAVLTMNTLLDAFALGSKQTFLYQLLDAYPDPQNKDFDSRLGLFDIGFRPKAAAAALHNMIAILQDGSRSARNFALRDASLSVQNLPATGHSLILEKADGTDMVILWNEPKIWNSQNKAELPITPTKVVLALNGAPRSALLYDPLHSVSADTTINNTTAIELNLAERPIIVALAPQ